jgi:DNA-binding response OmpR family regulator
VSSDTKKPIGSILLKQRAVTKQQLDEALRTGKRGDPPLVSRLTEQGIIRETQALKALSEQSGCPGIDLNQVVIRLDDLQLVPREMAERHCFVPVLVKGNRMFVAMSDPTDRNVLNQLEMVTGKRAFPYIALKATLRRVITGAYEARERQEKHFIGPNCSEETLRKMGVSRPQRSPEPMLRPRGLIDETPSAQFEKRLRPSNPKIPIIETPVVVDDHMAAASSTDDDVVFDEPSFPNLEVPQNRKPPLPPPKRTDKQGVPSLLVVDNDEESRGLVAAVFRERGYLVHETDRGDIALQIVREQPPDVIILEATLPHVHGFQVARELKGSERYRSIRIIMVSALYRGWRFAEDLKANYGVDGFIEKPFQIDDVVHAVEHARRTSGQLGSTSSEAEPYLAAGIAAYKAGRLEEATAQLKAGIDIDPLAYKLHFHLGLLYGKLGQLYDAIQELETTLSIRPDYFAALKNLAVLYQNAGFRNKAIEMWERSLANAPDDATRESIKRLLVAVL